MKILWGINGTGNGHLTKSLHLINALESKGHEVDILVSGKRKNIVIGKKIKYDLKGFSFNYKNGEVDLFNTLKEIDLLSFLKDIKLNLTSYDAIFTDFEPITAWAAKLKKRKIVGISHQYSFIYDNIPLPYKKNYLADFFLRKYAPVSLPLGLHFFKYNQMIFLPIIRKEITQGISSNIGNITVYLPGYDSKFLIDFFNRFDREVNLFLPIKENQQIKKVKLFSLSTEMFTQSLLNCDTIITGAGFETPSEALYLNKNLIVVPLKNQYEQLANAAALEQLGVRVEYDLSNIKNDLFCKKVKWDWLDPTDEILEKSISFF